MQPAGMIGKEEHKVAPLFLAMLQASGHCEDTDGSLLVG